MRSSDWSSDVCSSDLASLLIGGDVQYLFDAPTGASELNLRDRIEMRIDGNRILGTGPLPIDSARVLSAELAGTLGSFHFQGEYFDFNVEPTPGNGPRNRKSTRLNSSH